GAGSPVPGLPGPTFELGFKDWPPPQVHPTAWYFGPGGTLAPTRAQGDAADEDIFHPDPSVRPRGTLPNGDHAWDTLPPYNWQPLAEGPAVAYARPPLDEDVTLAGPGSVDLWLRSSAPDTDLQVTLSEIRPDGLEMYVQNGWLRASHRRLDRKDSTILDPRPT